MLQWLKRSLASLLGDKKDLVKNLPIIKSLNKKANIDLDSKRSNLLKENFEELKTKTAEFATRLHAHVLRGFRVQI